MAKRTGLGRGIGALIPTDNTGADRPVDVFFPTSEQGADAQNAAAGQSAAVSDASSTSIALVERGHGVVPGETSPRGVDSRSGVENLRRDDSPAGENNAESRAGTGAGEAGSPATGSAGGDDGLLAVPGARLARLDPADIAPNAVQPRTVFAQEELDELVQSIREVGVLQPIVVRPIPDAPADGPHYELVMGERRLRASKIVGLETIPAVVRDTADDVMLRDALLENLHRANLNPLEEASAYQQLLADFGITQDELANRIGRSRPQITNTIRLLKLPEAVQTRVAAGVLSAGHARAILSVGDAAEMERLADKIVNEDLSVRGAEAAAAAGPRPVRLARPAAGRRQGQLDEIAERLGDRLSTRVRVSLGARKGQVVIDFATVGDLNRILGELGEPGFPDSSPTRTTA